MRKESADILKNKTKVSIFVATDNSGEYYQEGWVAINGWNWFRDIREAEIFLQGCNSNETNY